MKPTNRERIAQGECISDRGVDHCPVCVDMCEASHWEMEVNETIKNAMPNTPDTEVKDDRLRKAVISFQDNLEDYKRMRDGWKPQTPQYETYDLMVREYRKIIDILLPITLNTHA